MAWGYIQWYFDETKAKGEPEYTGNTGNQKQLGVNQEYCILAKYKNFVL